MNNNKKISLIISEVGSLSKVYVYWLLFAFASLSFLITLPLKYVGEEAVYTLTSYEMWFHREYLTPLLYGEYYGRPPLYELMIIPVALLTGWAHVLIAARLVTMTATLISALLLRWFTLRLTGDKIFAVFAALVYITLGDVFFYGGWLCYADPVFAMFVSASMIFGWIALSEEKYKYIFFALVAVTAAFLSKVLTAYVFYGVTILVIAYRQRRWYFLLSWRSLFFHGLAFGLPYVWYHLVPAGKYQSHSMVADISDKLLHKGGWEYLKQVVVYPLQTIEQFLPVAGLLIYAYLRRWDLGKWRKSPEIVTMLLVTFVNYLPYWLSPQSGIRYLMPLFPFAGLMLAYLAFYGGPPAREWTLKLIIAAIALKFVLGFWGSPFDKRFRGAMEGAQDIVRIADKHPLYVTDVAASGLTTVAYIDSLIMPRAPLVTPPASFEDGFVISLTPDQNMGMVYKKYRIGGKDDLYLLCRGSACGNK